MDAVAGRVVSGAAREAVPKQDRAAGAPPQYQLIPRHSSPYWRGLLCFGLLLTAAGCDDGTVISRVDRTTTLDRSRILSMAKVENTVPLELHGVPWAGASAEEVAANVRLPNSFPPEIRFRAIAPGVLDSDQDRVVMVFNPSRTPNVSRLCAQSAPQPTAPPKDGPFQAFVALCDGPEWMGMGVLDAERQAAGDWPEFTRATRVLFSRIFADFTGRSEK